MAKKKNNAAQHNNKHNDKAFNETLKIAINQGLQKQFNRGLEQGARAITKVIHDRAIEEDTSAEEKLEKIIAFCKPFIEEPKKETIQNTEEEKPNEGSEQN